MDTTGGHKRLPARSPKIAMVLRIMSTFLRTVSFRSEWISLVNMGRPTPVRSVAGYAENRKKRRCRAAYERSWSHVQTGIPILASGLPSSRHPTPFVRAVSGIVSILSDPGALPQWHPWLFGTHEDLELPYFQGIAATPFRSPTSVPSRLLPLSSCLLSGRHRQRRDPPHHASKEPPRQVALCEQQPVIPGVLDQPPAGLHQPLLQARQRPVANPLRQCQPPPQVPQVGRPAPGDGFRL